jgi:hypothetical protein
MAVKLGWGLTWSKTVKDHFLLLKFSSKNSGHERGARKLTGDNLTVWPELSTLG